MASVCCRVGLVRHQNYVQPVLEFGLSTNKEPCGPDVFSCSFAKAGIRASPFSHLHSRVMIVQYCPSAARCFLCFWGLSSTQTPHCCHETPLPFFSFSTLERCYNIWLELLLFLPPLLLFPSVNTSIPLAFSLFLCAFKFLRVAVTFSPLFYRGFMNDFFKKRGDLSCACLTMLLWRFFSSPSRPLLCGKQATLSGETWVTLRGMGSTSQPYRFTRCSLHTQSLAPSPSSFHTVLEGGGCW